MRFRSVQDLARYGFGAAEWYLFNSSGKTRTNTLDGAVVALELVAKTAGLNIGAGETSSLIVNPGGQQGGREERVRSAVADIPEATAGTGARGSRSAGWQPALAIRAKGPSHPSWPSWPP